jgi:hypothetical protein
MKKMICTAGAADPATYCTTEEGQRFHPFNAAPAHWGADANQAAFRIVQQATAEPDYEPRTPPAKNPAAVALGRLGGKKGGTARAAKLTPEQRKEIARKAALARWAKKANT